MLLGIAIIKKVLHLLGFDLMYRKDMFKDSTKIIKNYNPSIVDVGGYVGSTVSYYLKLFNSPSITVYEPTPYSFNVLKEKYGSNKKITLVNKAVYDCVTEIPFYDFEERGYANSIFPNVNNSIIAQKSYSRGTKMTVKTITLDCKHTSIDLLKIDAQGSEYKILKGCDRLLTEKRIKVIIVELGILPIYRGSPTFIRIVNYLAKKGYIIKDFYNPVHYKDQLKFMDVMFIRE